MKAIKRITWLIAAITAMLLPTGATAQVDAAQVLVIGRNVLALDDYMLAIQYFNLAIKAKPYLDEPYYYRALAKLYLDDYSGAEEDCTAAIERNKYRGEVFKLRGFVRQMMHADSLAVTDYDRGLELTPHDPWLFYYKGVAQGDMGKYDDATESFHRLFAMRPNFEEALAPAARLMTLKGDTIGALDFIERALKHNPSAEGPHTLRADILLKQQKWEEALNDYDVIVSYHPDDPDLYINRAYIRYNADNYVGAMDDYTKAIMLDPDNRIAVYNRALLRYEVRDLNGAAADFTRVLQFDPSNFHALFNRCLIYMNQKRYKQALADFRTIIRQHPRFYVAYYGVAECLQALGDNRGAMENVLKAESLIRSYNKNPRSNPLENPVITRGKANVYAANYMKKHEDDLKRRQQEEDDISDVELYNRLITVETNAGTAPLAFSEKIKGRVQDRDVKAQPRGMLELSYIAPDATLPLHYPYFRELDELNQSRYLSDRVYLTDASSATAEEASEAIFNHINNLNTRIISGNPAPGDYLGRAIAYMSLKNYDAAEADFTKALEMSPSMLTARLGRATARARRAGLTDDLQLQRALLSEALDDCEKGISADSRVAACHYNKGVLMLLSENFRDAHACFSKALELSPSFADAYFNRALCRLPLGDRAGAIGDMRKAGELGIPEAYNILKRLK